MNSRERIQTALAHKEADRIPYDLAGTTVTIYFHLIDSPMGKAGSLSGNLHLLPQTDWDSYTKILRNNLNEQIVKVDESCGIADRNTAGLTENSLRIRGYENWFMDTVADQGGVEALFDRIVNDKLNYWDTVIDWAIETGNEHKIQVISECDDLGSQTTTILDPDTLRQLVIPRFKTIVFAPVHNIQNDVSPENFRALWDTLQKYGKY